MTDPLAKIIKTVGTQERLGKLLGVPQSTISFWKVSGRGIPAEKAVELEEATGGEIPRWMSRPDLWKAPKKTGKAHAR